jgi:hypothetical protein
MRRLVFATCVTASVGLPALALQPRATQPLAITHVTVIDVERGRRLPDRTVLIVADTIASVGPAASARLPNGTRVVDGHGKFLIAGLIDTHVHLALFAAGERDSVRALGALLAHGITGVRDAGAGGRDAWLIALRALVTDSVGPRIYVSGMVAGRTIKRSGTDTRTFVRQLVALGVDGLKIRDGLSNDDLRIVIEEGARAALPVYGHTFDAVNRDHDQEYTLDVVRLGVTGTMHVEGIPQRGTTPVPPPPPGPRFGPDNWQKWWLYHASEWLASDSLAEKTLIDTMVARHAWLEPTLVTEDWIANPDTYRAQWRKERLPGTFATFHEGWPTFEGAELAQFRRAFDRMGSFVRRFHAAGGVVVAGTDCVPRCGYGLQQELTLLVRSGLSPADALKAATVDAARVLGWGARLGRVAAGQWADLVLLDADPLVDIANARRVAAVISNGRYLDRAALDALLARDRT